MQEERVCHTPRPLALGNMLDFGMTTSVSWIMPVIDARSDNLPTQRPRRALVGQERVFCNRIEEEGTVDLGRADALAAALDEKAADGRLVVGAFVDLGPHHDQVGDRRICNPGAASERADDDAISRGAANQVLAPLRTKLSPLATAVVVMPAGSEPAPGSVRPKQPTSLPLAASTPRESV